jgi:hypothetical protein
MRRTTICGSTPNISAASAAPIGFFVAIKKNLPLHLCHQEIHVTHV